ncbi:DnaJ family domain-containing protein [Desulfospira joergensenii]|uniref:DnaJ family domain-containing protein n=1 Tax=Desulfospira joergensenii TaxID=53329 RepID=UPI0003B6274F|nr:DnaJ family domain-containing protein [Desulfospira joergensenii]
MIPGFEAIVEERIKKAQREGAFENLEGANKPLDLEDQNLPEEWRLAHKILKNAGFLPPELELRKKITQAEDLLENCGLDSPEGLKIQKKLNFLLTKLNTLRGDRNIPLTAMDDYRDNLIKKIS